MRSPHYQPLAEGEIRLLTIDTTSLSPEIQISMSVAQLNEMTEYFALSYVWGSEADRRDIKLNGRNMSVTANLYDALVCLHKKIPVASANLPRKIWIDAICINQDDIAERNKQVMRMADIYTHAVLVWAYVGVEMENDKKGFDIMKALALKFDGLSSTLSLNHELPEDANQMIENSLRLPSLEVAWKALCGLLRRPWWTRAWIVQEIALAHSAIFSCGEHTIEMSSVLLVGELLRAYITTAIAQSNTERIAVIDRFERIEEGIGNASLLAVERRTQQLNRKLQGMDRQTLAQFAQGVGMKDAQSRTASLTFTEVADFILIKTHRMPGDTLMSVLLRFISRECSNPLDKIFAFRGLARLRKEPSFLPVNYSLSAPMLWRQVVQEHLKWHQNLDILYFFAGSQTPVGFSSWAHECTALLTVHPRHFEVKSEGIEFMASLGSSLQLGHQASGYHSWEDEAEKERSKCGSLHLCVNGFAVDTVIAVGQAYDPGDPSHVNSVFNQIQSLDSIQDFSEARFYGFDGAVLEQWKELAGVKEPFNQVKSMAFSLYRDQENDVAVGSENGQNDLVTAAWNSMVSSGLLKNYPTGQTNLDAFIQTLMMDSVPCQEYAPLFYRRLAILKGHGRGNPFDSMYINSNLTQFRFYVTKEGYYGLATCDVQVGDKVCLLYGSDVPFLLRKISGTEYKLLNWSFVLGLMNGEAVANANDGQFSDETFCLV